MTTSMGMFFQGYLHLSYPSVSLERHLHLVHAKGHFILLEVHGKLCHSSWTDLPVSVFGKLILYGF